MSMEERSSRVSLQHHEGSYESVTTMVRTPQGTLEEFEVKVGLYQGSSLSPLIFIIVIADDLVISATSEKNLEAQLRKWKKALEGRGLKMNMKKTVVMRSSKGAKRKINIKVESSAKYEQVEEFKYRGSTMASEGGCERAVKDRVKAAWAKWREVSVMMFDKNLPAKMKPKIYKTVIRPVLLYRAETWTLRKREPAAENGNENAEVDVGNQSKRAENKRRGVS
ncbi:uncharacterized protein LOC125034637 [Penaeus chinensis]|uniref:uncharacterized protein LOC125034637 n=1 Tax=Penaeus chinensis TaxID=139456 RepID=UPI001FB5DE4F|nr:uncharacterized protein LOC125034637 [Penaeus chinensis]